MTYIRGETLSDGNRFLPYSDNDMIYDEDNHWYTPTIGLFKEKLGKDLNVIFGVNQANIECENVRDLVLDYIYETLQNEQEVKEFMIARNSRGREGIKRMYLAQMRYKLIDAYDLDENELEGNMVSPRAIRIGNNPKFMQLGYKGRYSFKVNPDITDDDGKYNGY